MAGFHHFYPAMRKHFLSVSVDCEQIYPNYLNHLNGMLYVVVLTLLLPYLTTTILTSLPIRPP
jgi:hypothetical protein